MFAEAAGEGWIGFVVVAETATKEGPHGLSGSGQELPEAVEIGARDSPWELSGSCL